MDPFSQEVPERMKVFHQSDLDTKQLFNKITVSEQNVAAHDGNPLVGYILFKSIFYERYDVAVSSILNLEISFIK